VPNSKLVSLPVDAEGKPYATPEMIDTYHDAFVAEGSNPISRGLDAVLAALPEAVVVGEDDREALAFLISRETDVLPDTAWHAANALLAAGYRKTAILDRSRLIEEIAEVYSHECADDACCGADLCGDCTSKATALLARVEDDR